MPSGPVLVTHLDEEIVDGAGDFLFFEPGVGATVNVPTAAYSVTGYAFSPATGVAIIVPTLAVTQTAYAPMIVTGETDATVTALSWELSPVISLSY